MFSAKFRSPHIAPEVAVGGEGGGEYPEVDEDSTPTSEKRSIKIVNIARTSPVGFIDGSIRTNVGNGQVQLVSRISNINKPDLKPWTVHKVMDELQYDAKAAKHAHVHLNEGKNRKHFSSQKDMWDEFHGHYDEFLASKAPKLSVVTLGSSGSGKSYTLYGDSSIENRGIIPRLLERLFDPTTDWGSKYQTSHVQLKLFIAWKDQIIDLLNPIKGFSPHGAVFESTDAFMDVMILPLKEYTATSLAQCLTIISGALKAMSYFLVSNCSVLNNTAHLFLSMNILSVNKKTIRTVEFIEVAGVMTPFEESPHTLGSTNDQKDVEFRPDPFSGQSMSMQALSRLFLPGDSQESDDSGGRGQGHSSMMNGTLLSFLLKGLFRKHERNPCMALLISCLRGNQTNFEENAAVLSFLQKIEDIHWVSDEDEEEEEEVGGGSGTTKKIQDSIGEPEILWSVDVRDLIEKYEKDIANMKVLVRELTIKQQNATQNSFTVENYIKRLEYYRKKCYYISIFKESLRGICIRKDASRSKKKDKDKDKGANRRILDNIDGWFAAHGMHIDEATLQATTTAESPQAKTNEGGGGTSGTSETKSSGTLENVDEDPDIVRNYPWQSKGYTEGVYVLLLGASNTGQHFCKVNLVRGVNILRVTGQVMMEKCGCELTSITELKEKVRTIELLVQAENEAADPKRKKERQQMIQAVEEGGGVDLAPVSPYQEVYDQVLTLCGDDSGCNVISRGSSRGAVEGQGPGQGQGEEALEITLLSNPKETILALEETEYDVQLKKLGRMDALPRKLVIPDEPGVEEAPEIVEESVQQMG